MSSPAGTGQRGDDRLVVAISSRALFDMRDSHELFEDQGLDVYSRYQVEHEDDILEPGIAFPVVRKLLALNAERGDQGAADNRRQPKVEIILLSRNSGDTGLRIFNSIQHHGLHIERAVFTNGESPFRYIEPFAADLFLSAHDDDVRQALNAGYAAARLLPGRARSSNDLGQLRIAFDGDAVLFSDESERIYQEQGLEAFADNEKDQAAQPLSGGPFREFLAALHRIQSSYPAEHAPIRTALVTARSAPAHKRVILTLRNWGIRIDEALFLGGRDKGAFLKAFGADIFFDDQRGHIESAAEHVAAGHVLHGVTNESE